MRRFIPKKKYQISRLDELASAKSYISVCEAAYRRRLKNVASDIIASGRRIVLLSGPSASGKTTSSLKLTEELGRRGVHAALVSLDNFYLNGEDYPKLPNGEYDYESLYALDIDRVNACLAELYGTGESWLPRFDFVTRKRTFRAEHIQLGENDVLVIEGIHGLNPELTRSLPEGSVLKIYAGLRTEYYEGDEKKVETADIRLVRRMIRDVRERAHDAEATLLRWQSIRDGEAKWIKPHKKEADLLLNTSLDYEPCLYAPMVKKLALEGSGKSRQDMLEQLAARFEGIISRETAEVPADSLLVEFIGKVN